MDILDNMEDSVFEFTETEEIQEESPVVQKKEKLVYVGPNMGGELPMTRFRIYSGGLPKEIQARCETDPAFAKLFVSVDKLDTTRAQISNKKSVLGKAYQAVVKAYMAGKGGK